jgi:hypothetical protein
MYTTNPKLVALNKQVSDIMWAALEEKVKERAAKRQVA